MSETGGSFPVPPGDTTNALQPIPEKTYAPVFPYRGMEQHGVPVPAKPWIPQDANEQSWEGEEVFEPESVPLEPVPVYIVRESAREIRSWRSLCLPVPKSPVLLVGQNERMNRVRIRNIGLATDDTVAWIGHTPNMAARLSGYPIYPGESVDICTEEEVYALCDPTATDADVAQLAVIIEHAVV